MFETGVKHFMLLKNNVTNVKDPGQTSWIRTETYTVGFQMSGSWVTLVMHFNTMAQKNILVSSVTYERWKKNGG